VPQGTLSQPVGPGQRIRFENAIDYMIFSPGLRVDWGSTYRKVHYSEQTDPGTGSTPKAADAKDVELLSDLGAIEIDQDVVGLCTRRCLVRWRAEASDRHPGCWAKAMPCK
jgi:hypothetical protein